MTKTAIQQALKFEFGCSYGQIANLTNQRTVWANSKNVKPWKDRDRNEKQRAIVEAAKLLNVAIDLYSYNGNESDRPNVWLIDIGTGNSVKLGANVKVGMRAEFGDAVEIFDNTTIGSLVQFGHRVTIGSNTIVGNEVKIGDYVTIGHDVVIGDDVVIGEYTRIRDGVKLGRGVKIGPRATIGEQVELSDGTKVEELTIIQSGSTSSSLNDYFREAYQSVADEHIFWKWVTQERKSPIYEGSAIVYEKGTIIEVPAEVSDRQCAPGLHVVRPGYRPEWVGLVSSPDHKLVPVKVLVNVEDILNPGLPGNDAVVCVRKLQVMS